MLGTAGTDGGITSMIGALVVGAGIIAGVGAMVGAGLTVMPCGAGTSEVLAGGVVVLGAGIFFGGTVRISPAGAGAGVAGTTDGAQPPLAQPVVVPQPLSQQEEPWPRPANSPRQRDRKPPPP